MTFNLTYKAFGERSILIEWPPLIDERILFDIASFKQKIVNNKIKLVVDVNQAYNSLLVNYENSILDFDYQINILIGNYKAKETYKIQNSRLWKIPVCYDEDFAIDLDNISVVENISKEEIIKRHFQVNYTVYFIGFLPGFLYLGGLDERLYFPRKESPRLKVDKGAVAIGGKQTGVYPNESPGGWNIIGNTPISFFDVSKNNPCFAKSGDSIQFYPISLKEYHNTKALVEVGVYQIESEVIND